MREKFVRFAPLLYLHSANLTIPGTLDLINYHNQLQSKSIVLAYKGKMSDDLLDCILAMVEDKLSLVEPQMSLRRKVYTIIVEVLQNIYHHRDKSEPIPVELEDIDAVVFMLGKTDNGYTVVTGNYLPKLEVESLRGRIDFVNSLSPEELKAKYREALNNNQMTAKGGAGLGIIDIAKRSGEKLEYDFRPTDTSHTYFSLTVKIPA